MKVIILAAGKGERFHPKEKELSSLPKSFLPITTHFSLLDLALKNLSSFPLIDVSVVIGFQKELFLKKYPFLHFIENPDFATENTSKSLLKALYSIGTERDVLFMNGDVLCNPQAFFSFLQSLKDTSSLLVTKCDPDEEAVKFATKEGFFTHISKIISKGEGEALGINFFKKKDLLSLIDGLEKCEKTDYFEKGIEIAIEKGIQIKPSYCSHNECIEVDFWEDFIQAKSLYESWQIY